jgi:multimeric flavodoxin WrbA
MPTPDVRKGQAGPPLPREEFSRRFERHFIDPAFADQRGSIDRLERIAWDGYDQSRKSPITRSAGPGYADPTYELSVDWLATRDALRTAGARHADASSAARVLLVCASPRNEKTCPGEMSKTFRLTEAARATLISQGADVDFLDLSLLTSEYGKVIYPCKGCVSTAMPLCHWPCSCYPNHSLGQVNDWMADIYPRWVAAHGILIITPVHWYQAPSVLKLMIDRLVCADGGNADPSTTHGKHAEEAKTLELDGWEYPKHLAGRSFGVVVHGDAAGTEALRRALCDWLRDMGLVQAGSLSCFDRLIGYLKPYATSHADLDCDGALLAETANAALALVTSIQDHRHGTQEPDRRLKEPRPK